jgi:hypothetical protein
MIKKFKEFVNEGFEGKNQIMKFQDMPFALDDINDYSIYLNIFNKIDIYNKNTKLIAEGRTKYSNYIPYNANERYAIGLVLENYFTNTIIQYVNDSNLVTEKFSFDDAKNLIKGGKEKIKELIEKFKEKIPSEVIEAYEFLIKSLNKGIKTAKDLLETIGKLLQRLGETIIEAFEKLKLFNPEYCSALPESDIDTHGLIEFKDENQKRLIGYVINEVSENVKEKQKEKDENLNEGIGKTLAIGGAVALFPLAPGLAFLGGGGYGLYRLLKYIGPKLSDKLEPYLLSDKTKEFANKLYNNKFARYSLGLKIKNNGNKPESRLRKAGEIIWSVFVNFIIATLVSSIISLFVTTLLGTGPATGLVIATIIGSKNIFKLIINRVLNFKKEVKLKNGNTKIYYFFDMTLMIGILSSVASIVVKIPGFNEWFNKMLGKIFDFGLTKANAAEPLKFDRNALKVDGNGGESENLGSFASVKKLLDKAEDMEEPVYGSSNSLIKTFSEITKNSSSSSDHKDFSQEFVKSLTSITKTSDKMEMMGAAKSSVSEDGTVSSLFHMFTTSSKDETFIDNALNSTNTLKEISLGFTTLQDGESNIGFRLATRLIESDGTNEGSLIKGILSSAGEILQIDNAVGVSADELVGQHWDDVINAMVE